MPTATKPVVIFREDQRFRQPLLWVILIMFASVTLGSALYVMRSRMEAEAAALQLSSWALLLVFVVLPISLTLILLAIAKLQIEVSSAGLFVRFVPLHFKVRKIDLAGVERVEAVTYKAVREYGGYGIRLLPHAKAYNTGGDQGVRIDYKNGYHLLLGTQHPRELCDAITRVLPTLEATHD